MPTRYVAMRRRAAVADPPDEYAWDQREEACTRTVHEVGNEPVDTGLINAQGVTIYRVSERKPIGFKVRRNG